MEPNSELRTVKGWYWFSQAAAELSGMQMKDLPLSPIGRLYTCVTMNQDDSDAYSWPDKLLVEIGPFETAPLGRQYEDWDGRTVTEMT